ncbi:MAG: hypothetical protein AAFX06_10945 [Planctomycetota bacterium]
MAGFLEAQNSVSFTIEYELNQQFTMGAVGGVNPAFERFEFKFARPNLLKIVDSYERDFQYRWEMASDGKYLLRLFNGTVSVEDAAPSLAKMLGQRGTSRGWAYYLGPREILSMFSRETLSKRIDGWSIRYGGIRDFGAVETDYVVIDYPEEIYKDSLYKKLHLFIARGEYPIPLMMVRDGDLVYESGFEVDDPSNRLRSRDTEWRFKNWRFNFPVDRESFKLTMPSQKMVDSMGDFESATKLSMPPFVGTKLPSFSVVNPSGKVIESRELLGDKTTVLLLWHDESKFLEDWKSASKAEAEYGADQIQTVAVYIGSGGSNEVASEMFDRLCAPEELEKAGIVNAPRFFIAKGYSDRRLLQNERYALSGVCAVIDASGTVIDKNPSYSKGLQDLVLRSALAVIEGRDYVDEELRRVEDNIRALQRKKDAWNKKFESSWKGD